ncbi:hypothetical protein, partial [Caldalkalibacillus salinus]|uniref:hypothetical protein n=1 Tax=Caldalkalibacillus salinus TaxID=2803787 RepID=UPI001F2D6D30
MKTIVISAWLATVGCRRALNEDEDAQKTINFPYNQERKERDVFFPFFVLLLRLKKIRCKGHECLS